MKVTNSNGSREDYFSDGAFLEVGVTNESETSAAKVIEDMISQITGWDNKKYTTKLDRVGIIDINDIQIEIYADDDINESLIQDPLHKGIWYRSGFAFYTDD